MMIKVSVLSLTATEMQLLLVLVLLQLLLEKIVQIDQFTETTSIQKGNEPELKVAPYSFSSVSTDKYT